MIIKKISLRILIIGISTFLLLDLLLVSDKLLGKVIPKNNDATIDNTAYLPPNVKVRYLTPEFDINVQTNSLGFRGRDYDIKLQQNTIRFMAFGDSNTYGWGVNLKDTWVNRLENDLSSEISGKQIEVLNFGMPGKGPDFFLEAIQKYLPIYKPQYVLLLVTQGSNSSYLADSPRQEVINDKVIARREQIISELKPSISFSNSNEILYSGKIIRDIFPNFSSLISQYKTIDIRQTFIDQMKWNISVLDEFGINQYEKMSPIAKRKFLQAELNPVIFRYATNSPDKYIRMLNTDDPNIIQSIGTLTEVMRQIQDAVSQFGAKLIIVDLPHPIMVSEKYAKLSADMGMTFAPDSWKSDIPTNITKNIAEVVGAAFFSPIEEFRNNCPSDCFYDYDFHLTKKGQALLAREIGKYLRDNIIVEK